MLIDRATLQAGHRVLIWGAAGGLGVFATQLCRAAGAECVGVVSSAEKGELVKQLGAMDYIDRNEFAGMMRRGGETPEEEKARFAVSRDFGKRVKEILGDSPDIVFEHVGKATFPTSVFVVKPFGKVVICGATSGYNLDFDVRYLWMRQKQIIGSHFANAWQCNQGQPAHRGRQDPARAVAYDGLRPGRGGPPAHAREQAPRARSRSSSAPPRRARARRPRAPARSARRSAPDGRRRPHPVVRDRLPRRQARGRAGRASRRSPLRYGARSYAVYRFRDDRYKFLQIAEFETKLDFERYWHGAEFTDFRVLASSWYQVPVLYSWADLVVAGTLEPDESVRGRAASSAPAGGVSAVGDPRLALGRALDVHPHAGQRLADEP